MPTINLSTRKQSIVVATFFLVLILLFWIALIRNTSPVDWQSTYYPAARAVLNMHSPYVDSPLFFAPVWALFPIIPFAVLPVNIGGALFFVISLLGFTYLGYKMGCSPIGIAALLLSAPVLNCIQTGNIEWIPFFGAFMPAPLGLIFLSMKPQSTIAIIGLIMAKAIHQGGLRELIKIVIPTLILFVLSCFVYGLWFMGITGAFRAAGAFLLSTWPYAVPAGIFLFFLAVKKQRLDYAIAASPLLSPYAILLTWSGFILSFAKSTRAMVTVSFISWVIWISFRMWFYN